MNSVYSYMTKTQIDALRRAMDCGFIPPYECMANRIFSAYNENVVNDMATKASKEGLFGEQTFIMQQEALADELSQRICNLEEVIVSFRERIEEIMLAVDAAKMLATEMDTNTVHTIAAERKNDLSSAEYIYYIAICSHYAVKHPPIAAALYKVEVDNPNNIRYIKDLIEVDYDERNTLAAKLVEHPEVIERGITKVTFHSNMDNKLSKKPFMKRFDFVEYIEDICC